MKLFLVLTIIKYRRVNKKKKIGEIIENNTHIFIMLICILKFHDTKKFTVLFLRKKNV